jgi:hypothetical protein
MFVHLVFKTVRDWQQCQVQYVASQSLTTLGHDPVQLGELLMRVALESNTPSAAAVLRSLLALSSLHRYGVQSQAMELKISSLKALALASKSSFGAKEVIQHVAAGMLLCSFEVTLPSLPCVLMIW